jgi:hypothetical protein
MAAGDILAYPAAANGVQTTSSGSTAWADGAEVTLVPASTITTPFAIVGLWIVPENSAGPDTTYQTIFRLTAGGTEVVVFPYSWRTETARHFYLTPEQPVWFAEPVEVGANAEVTLKSASSTVRTYHVKLLYQELAAVGGTTHDLAGTPAGTSTLTGALLIQRLLAGTLAGSSTSTGAVNVDISLAATPAGTSTMTGTLVFTHSLAGTMAGTSTMTGVLLAGFSGTLAGTSTMTGALSLGLSLAGQMHGDSVLGDQILPDTTLYPSSGLVPGAGSADLSVNFVLMGTSTGTSSMSGGYTDLAGMSQGTSAMGFPRLPATTLYPSSSLYLGLLGGELDVSTFEDQVESVLKPPELSIAASETELKPFEVDIPSDAEIVKPFEDAHSSTTVILKGG